MERARSGLQRGVKRGVDGIFEPRPVVFETRALLILAHAGPTAAPPGGACRRDPRIQGFRGPLFILPSPLFASGRREPVSAGFPLRAAGQRDRS
jgi:hypothetical protein